MLRRPAVYSQEKKGPPLPGEGNVNTQRMISVFQSNPLTETSKLKQRELRTYSLRKGDPKHNKLSKMRRQRNTQQMKEQGKKTPDQKMKRKEAVYLKKNSE